MIPARKWSFDKIARYGNKFYNEGNRKITLNFAPTTETPIDVDVLLKYFSPEKFLIKITPINPTFSSRENGIESYIKPGVNKYPLIDSLNNAGYRVILSIGELEENRIGSNCGQYINKARRIDNIQSDIYTYPIEEIQDNQ